MDRTPNRRDHERRLHITEKMPNQKSCLWHYHPHLPQKAAGGKLGMLKPIRQGELKRHPGIDLTNKGLPLPARLLRKHPINPRPRQWKLRTSTRPG